MSTPKFDHRNLTATDNAMINRILSSDGKYQSKDEIVIITGKSHLSHDDIDQLRALLKYERDLAKSANEQKFIDELVTRYNAKEKKTAEQQYFLEVYAIQNKTEKQQKLFNKLVTAERRKQQAKNSKKVVTQAVVKEPLANERKLREHKKYTIGGGILPLYENNTPLAVLGDLSEIRTFKDLVHRMVELDLIYHERTVKGDDGKPLFDENKKVIKDRIKPMDSKTGKPLFDLFDTAPVTSELVTQSEQVATVETQNSDTAPDSDNAPDTSPDTTDDDNEK